MDTARPPVVVVMGAMGVHSGFYRDLVAEIQRRGWAARTVPARGADRDTTPPSRHADWGYADLLADLRAEIAVARDEDPERPVVALGHSLGGQVAVLHLLDGGHLDGLVLTCASEPFFVHYGRAAPFILGLGLAVPAVTAVNGRWPARGFGGPQPRTLMRQWARFVRRRRLPLDLPGAKPAGLRTPTLAVLVEGDRFSPPQATRGLTRWVDPSALSWWTYQQDHAPKDRQVDHLRWAKSPAPVVEQMVAWWPRRHSPTAG